MSWPKVGSSDIENPHHAARRAAARVLRVPVRVGQHVQLEPELFVLGRDLTRRRYRYEVYRAEPHPDFAKRLAIPGPHLWLTPSRALAGDYDRLSESCRWVVARLVRDGLLPGRSQYTAVLIMHQNHNGMGQFLLRHEPGWGYALPTKRRQPRESYAAAAERVAREELGLDPAKLGLMLAREAVVTARDLSQSEQTSTFYCHGVFEATVPDRTAFTSTSPLVWVNATTIIAGQVHDTIAHDGNPAPPAPVSPTAKHILQELDELPMIDPDVVLL
jgi:ADP-ribose pyrophosphatase YjhB (NUDIX family)